MCSPARLDKVNDRLRYTAQLFDGASGHELWSARYDDEGVDPKAPGPDVATRIYDALAGLEGRLYAEEERRSWSKDEASLDAYDYYLRGASLFLRFTPDDNEKALATFARGPQKIPERRAVAGEARVVLPRKDLVPDEREPA